MIAREKVRAGTKRQETERPKSVRNDLDDFNEANERKMGETPNLARKRVAS